MTCPRYVDPQERSLTARCRTSRHARLDQQRDAPTARDRTPAPCPPRSIAPYPPRSSGKPAHGPLSSVAPCPSRSAGKAARSRRGALRSCRRGRPPAPGDEPRSHVGQGLAGKATHGSLSSFAHVGRDRQGGPPTAGVEPSLRSRFRLLAPKSFTCEPSPARLSQCGERATVRLTRGRSLDAARQDENTIARKAPQSLWLQVTCSRPPNSSKEQNKVWIA